MKKLTGFVMAASIAVLGVTSNVSMATQSNPHPASGTVMTAPASFDYIFIRNLGTLNPAVKFSFVNAGGNGVTTDEHIRSGDNKEHFKKAFLPGQTIFVTTTNPTLTCTTLQITKKALQHSSVGFTVKCGKFILGTLHATASSR